MAGLSVDDFARPALRSAFSLAVKECVTASSKEALLPIAITAAKAVVDVSTNVSFVEVVFEQEGTSHSLGAREPADAIALLTSRLLSCCNAGVLDAILSKVGDQLQSVVLHQAQFLDLVLADSRVSEVPRTEAETPSSQPSTTASDGSNASEKFTLTVPWVIGMVSLLIAIAALRLVATCIKKSNEVSPRLRNMEVSNVRVLPS